MLSFSNVKYSGPLFKKNVKRTTDDAFKSRLRAVTGMVAGKISERTPVGSTGDLSQEIAESWVVKKHRNKWTGRIGTQQIYGSVIEYGRKYPGKFPPPAAILHWLKRKGKRLGLPATKQMAFLISRKIARRGFRRQRGYRMFGRGLMVMRPYIERTLGKIATDVARKLS